MQMYKMSVKTTVVLTLQIVGDLQVFLWALLTGAIYMVIVCILIASDHNGNRINKCNYNLFI